MNKTDGTKIYLTRGDTLRRQVVIQNEDGSDYQPAEGDRVRFALKLKPEDTKPLAFGEYVYDIELTKANGDVDTFIACACMKIMREVY